MEKLEVVLGAAFQRGGRRTRSGLLKSESRNGLPRWNDMGNAPNEPVNYFGPVSSMKWLCSEYSSVFIHPSFKFSSDSYSHLRSCGGRQYNHRSKGLVGTINSFSCTAPACKYPPHEA